MSIKKVFVTGATGYIGGSIATLLVKKGYEVLGLHRKAEDAEKLKALGIVPVQGSLADAVILKETTAKADAVIHAADADDPYAVGTFLEALKGTGKTFVYTSGSSILGNKDNGEKSDFIFTEDMPLKPRFEKAHRIVINDYILQMAQLDVRSIIIVPTMIYGEGTGLKKDSIQVPLLRKASKIKNAAVYIGKGENSWSNVHIEDLAELYVLALEKAKAGSYYYAENGVARLIAIAKSIQAKYGYQELLSITADEGVQYFGLEGSYFALASNSICNADKARLELGWKPKYTSIHDFV